MKEKTSETQNPAQLEAEKSAQVLSDLIKLIGLASKIKVSSRVTSKGNQPQVILEGQEILSLDSGSGLSQVEQKKTRFIINVLAKTFKQVSGNVDSLALLSRGSFASACITEIGSLPSKGNTFLCSLAKMPEGSIPCLYGSTDGINFAELLETVACAKTVGKKGLRTFVVFDTESGTSIRAKTILKDSVEVIPPELQSEFDRFQTELGPNITSQRVRAAEFLLGNSNDIFIFSSKEIFASVDKAFTLGKLLVLARLAGENPLLFKDLRANDILDKVASCTLHVPVVDMKAVPAGFSFYAREAVIAGDFPGIVAFPFKLTSHANIYKILEPYGSLFTPEKQSGAILCPMTRQRIQTKEQAEIGSDPCDVTVLAFLAQKFPMEFKKLMEDFEKSCRVLTPLEATGTGTKDNKFIVENYFPLNS